jgi:hypothetical protein
MAKIRVKSTAGRSLPGMYGLDAYELAVRRGFVGSEDKWLESLKGDAGINGLSAYEIAIAHGFDGTEAEWLAKQEAIPGPQGERGPPGPRGPRPDHEWSGTRLRFEKADGDWGQFVDLKGDKGEQGNAGTAAIGGGTVIVQQGNSYFPAGW